MEGDDYKLIREEVTYEVAEDGTQNKVILKFYEKNNKYYDNIKKAIYTYREKNREELNQKSAERRREKYNTDPEYRELMKQKRREQYQKSKKTEK